MVLDIDNWKEIGATLARNKTRTFLTAFGIFWGTVMLSLLWGGAQGLKGIMSANFAGFASNSAFLSSSRTTMPYHGYQKGMNWSLTQTDIDNIRAVVPELEAVSPMAERSTNAKNGKKSAAVRVQGIEPVFTMVTNPIINDGRFINDMDLKNDNKVCVLGQNIALNLFPAQNPIGEYVEMDNVYYRVVGVASQKSMVSIGGSVNDAVFIPISTLRRAYNAGVNVDYALLVARPGYTPTDLKGKIMRSIRVNHPIHPDDNDAIDFYDISKDFKMVDNVFSGIHILILFVGLSSLIAGIIGVGNIMWIIVKERTKEFGIRRALGAKPMSIMGQILSESAVLTLIAGTAGICFAVGILAVATKMISQSQPMMSDVNFQLSFTVACLIMVIFSVLGCLAGSIPAIKAMRIKPIEALNDK